MSHPSSRFAVAIHVLLLLAQDGWGGPVSSDAIAASVGSHPVLIRRLLGDLKQAGLVRATRGKEGGFSLGRPAQAICLSEVLDAAEPGLLFALHSRPNGNCRIGARIPDLLGTVFGGAKKAVGEHLGGVTLADLLARCGEEGAGRRAGLQT